MNESAYKQLAIRLDELPNGYPPTEDGAELRLLEKIFTPEEAALAAQLRLGLETVKEITERIGGDVKELKKQLKSMARKGLIEAGRAEQGLGYGLMPFVVGVYEMQIARLDAEMAQLFEDYYHQAFGKMVGIEPTFQRVIPVNETVRTGMEVRPFESAADIVADANAWGVLDCICRKQKALIGDPCDHPVDVCMILSKRSRAFDNSSVIHALDQDGAMATLKRAADAGLVHTVSNTQDGVHYICNCCTCSCGLLRGMAEMGIANVVARSAFVNQVDEDLCQGCEICVDYCQFDALSLDDDAFCVQVNETSCVGCGVCVPTCPDEALSLIRRSEEDVLPTPVSKHEWMQARAIERDLDLKEIL
ncbi:MAG: 4Fe-4S binding protein [Chloroflexota bacterium]|nr:4Fe-4S binding protein [Chloroflexota bacterium]